MFTWKGEWSHIFLFRKLLLGVLLTLILKDVKRDLPVRLVPTHCTWPVAGVRFIEYINEENSFLFSHISVIEVNFLFFFFNLRFYLFLERKGGRKRGRETSVCGCLLHTPPLGTWPAAQACALTGNQTSDPLLCRPALNPLSHTSQGSIFI